jgi:succinoglycan biosynthesis transport protein ExoP
MMTQRLPEPITDELDRADSALPWQDVVAAVYYHRRAVIKIFLIGTILSALWAFIQPPVYRGKAVLMVKDQRAQMSLSPDGRAVRSVEPASEEEINALTMLAFQSALLERVIERLSAPAGDGSDEPDVPQTSWISWTQDTISAWKWSILGIPDDLYRMLHGLPPPTELENRIMLLQARVLVTPVPDSNLLEVSYASESPRWAARVTNAVTSEMITAYTNLYESKDAYRFYQSQRTLLADTLSKAEAEMVAFRERVGADLLSLNMGDLQSRVAALELDVIEAEGRRAELEAQLNAPEEAVVADAQASDPESGTVGNPVVGELKQRLIGLEMQRSELLTRYTPTSVAVKDVDRQITEVRRLLANERSTSVDMRRRAARAKMDANDAKIAALQGQIAKYRDTIERLERVLPEWNRLQNNAQTQKESYLSYLRKEEEARVSSALDESQMVNIAIVERAQMPGEPEGAALKRTSAFGAALSLLIGIGLAFFRDWMDPSIKSAGQIERLVGLPVLGELQG